MVERLIDQRIKLRHIICFLEVVRLKSVMNAAKTLNVSQPAASKTIQELEELLGTTLFDRSRRSLFLTPQGETFARYAATSIAALRQGIEGVSQAEAERVIKVGALPTVSTSILPRAIERFASQKVRAKTRIVTGPNSYLLSLLHLGDVDFVIGRMAEPEAMIGLIFEHLYSERVVFVVRPDHPLLSAASFHLTLIEPYQILMPPPDSVIRPLAERLLLAHGITQLRSEVETVSDAFGRSFTRGSDAVWIISEGVVAQDVTENHLAVLPIDTAETLGPVGLTTRAETPLFFAADKLAQSIRLVARQRA